MPDALRALRSLDDCVRAIVRAVDPDELLSDVRTALTHPGRYDAAWVSEEGPPAGDAPDAVLAFPLEAEAAAGAAARLCVRSADGFRPGEPPVLSNLADLVADRLGRLRADGRGAAEAAAGAAAGAPAPGVILANIPDTILQVDRDRRIRYINRVGGGHRLEDVLGRPAFDFVPPESFDLHARAWEALTETGEPQEFEAPAFRADGSQAWYACRLVPTVEGGEWRGTTIVATDVTDRRCAEEALRESEARWKALVETAPAFISLLSSDGTFEYVNASVPGLDPAALVGANLFDYMPSDDAETARAAFARAVETGEAVEYVVRGVGPHGRTAWYRNRVRPFRRGGDGGPVVIAVTLDVTEKRQAEEDLRELNETLERRVADRTAELLRANAALERSERRRRKLAEQAPLGMLVVSPDGRTLEANPAWRDLWGGPAEGSDADALLKHEPLDRCGLLPHVRRALAGEAFVAPAAPCRPEGGPHAGEDRWVGLRAYPIRDEAGRVEEVVLLCEDQTDRRRMEAELRDLHDRLAHAGRLSLTGQMAAEIAHELHQPLGAAANYVAGALRRLGAGRGSADDLAAALRSAVAEVERAGAICGRIRDFLSGRGPVRERVDVEAVARDAVRLLHPLLEGRDIRAELRLAGGLPDVLADRVQLTQVLTNLIANAADALEAVPPDRRRLTVGTESPDGRAVEVTVADNGPGIPADRLEAVFEPFVSTKPDGLGMGLTVSRSIVEGHGGRLRARSEPGATEFRCSFPAVIPREPAGPG